MTPTQDQAPSVRPQLGLWDTVSILVGIVVGTGIYETPPLILQNVTGPWMALGVWALGGLLSLLGALCYAELASTYPRSGGDYVYLTRALGPWAGFLFGWAQLAVVLTGSTGMMAYVFADYAVQLHDLGPGSTTGYAVLAVVVLSVLNILGVVLGKRTQNLLTAAKVLGLGGILIAGLLSSRSAGSPTASVPAHSSSLAIAMVLVLFTYGGWSDAAFVTAELRGGRRTIARALILGTLGVTLIYLLVNVAYLWGLGFDRASQSKAVAADVVEGALGAWGAKAVCVLVMVTALGSMNGLIFSGSRVYSTLGADYRLFAWLGRWHPRLGSPVGALLAQAAITVALIVVVGTPAGRSTVDLVLSWIGLEAATWRGHGGFETLLRCTGPIFWLFFLLTGLSLFVLRARDRGLERPFSVPLYPLVPLVFCATCGYMIFAAVRYAGALGLVGAGLLLAGLPFFFLSQRRAAAPIAAAQKSTAEYA
jgi:amino acid transporter